MCQCLITNFKWLNVTAINNLLLLPKYLPENRENVSKEIRFKLCSEGAICVQR